MTFLIVSFLLVGSLPALLPKWRHALAAAGILFAALVLGLLYALRDLEAHPSGGDGPAFAGLILLFGSAELVVAASLVGRLIAHAAARALMPSTRRRVVNALLVFAFVPFALVCTLVALHLAATGLIALAALALFPFAWFALALRLAAPPQK